MVKDQFGGFEKSQNAKVSNVFQRVGLRLNSQREVFKIEEKK